MKLSGFLNVVVFGFLIFNYSSQLLAQNNQESDFRKAKNGVYVVAHRGAHNGIPENSIPAYQKAIDLGCDFVEIDVRTTKDGRFVSIHNAKVDEYVTGAQGKVSDYTFDELKALDIGSRVGKDWKDTRIPDLDEILQLCRGKIGIYLDLKDARIPDLVELIERYGMEHEILWYLNAYRIKEIREIESCCPDCIPMPDPGSEGNIEVLLGQIHARMLATDMGKLTETFVKIAHNHNAMVTVDEKDGTEMEWTQIINWKTDGIQTDRPEELISFLKKRNR
jgi:glycerophosphoryl diester phosphodiesterase